MFWGCFIFKDFHLSLSFFIPLFTTIFSLFICTLICHGIPGMIFENFLVTYSSIWIIMVFLDGFIVINLKCVVPFLVAYSNNMEFTRTVFKKLQLDIYAISFLLKIQIAHAIFFVLFWLIQHSRTTEILCKWLSIGLIFRQFKE